MQEKRKKVLICPLNWGLGHAARCIPLINALIAAGAEVVIAASGRSADLLEKEFPELRHVHFPGYEVSYSAKGFSFFKMMMRLPAMLLEVKREHNKLLALVEEEVADVVISDNRYGCFSSQCKSVFITHQINLPLPGYLKAFQGVANNIVESYIKKYSDCYIADTTLHQLAGNLSKVDERKISVKYTGPLSRFKNNSFLNAHAVEVLVVLSGPEPQRTILENKLISELSSYNAEVLFIRGLPGESVLLKDVGNIHFENHLSTEELNFHFLSSKYIVCRSGYSSIMDLAVTGRSAVIIPTPGQTEQEYLATYHHEKFHHVAILQDQINLSEAFVKVQQCKPLILQTYIEKVAADILS